MKKSLDLARRFGIGRARVSATYLDSSGETIFGGILDITSVDVNNTATALSFK